MMAQTRYMEIANFVTRFGEDAVLLDYYDEIVEPAFFGDHRRTYRDTTYLVVDPLHVLVGSGSRQSPAIAGRFVKDTVLHQQQRLVEGHLEAADATLESAPSSLFVLVLRGHRLLYLREHRGSPDLSQFESTIEQFMKRTRNQWIDAQYRQSLTSQEPVSKGFLIEQIPVPEVTITPVATKESIDEFFDRFSVLRAMQIRLEPLNEEPDLNEFFRDFRTQKETVGARKAEIEYRGTKHDGLNIAAASDQVKAAVDGQAAFVLEGLDREGRRLRGDNDHFKVRVPVDGEGKSVPSAAEAMGGTFTALVEDGAVGPGPSAERHEAKLLGLVARLGRR